jgi:hypothetical protein
MKRKIKKERRVMLTSAFGTLVKEVKEEKIVLETTFLIL